MYLYKNLSGLIITTIVFLLIVQYALAENSVQIFPIPKEMDLSGEKFYPDESTNILLPENSGDHDLFLARLLVAELGELHMLPISMEKRSDLPSDKKYFLMGTPSNDLINKYIALNQLADDLKQLGDEGYILNVSGDEAVIVANTDQGAMYGFESLRQIISSQNDQIFIPQIKVKDRSVLPFRGIRMYIPGRENIPFFKRFVRDFMALYKFNKLILEVNGVMRLDRHPEVNIGAIEFANELNYSRRGRPEGPHNQFQNSAHHDAGDGQILEKDEVAELMKYIRQFHIEVIPEIPSLTHAYYLLNRHRELAEIKDAEWPDTFCPSNPESYKLLFDVFDEYIEVIQPRMIHLGKDEWRMPVDVCERCKGKDYRELFVSDIQEIYNYLNSRGISIGMWGDHLLESVREKGYRDRKTKSGYEYRIPGGLTPEQVSNYIPKDILLFNWFWGDEKNDLALEQFGFKQVYGNFRPNISNWENRSTWASIIGGAPSSWAATTEFNFGKDLLFDFLGCANLLWSEHYLDHAKLSKVVRLRVPRIRGYLRGESLPGDDPNKLVSVDISAYFNILADREILGVTLDNLTAGEIGDRKFEIADPRKNDGKAAVVVGLGQSQQNELAGEVKGIRIDDDVSSLIFLHACTGMAGNQKSYQKIYNFDDTADLLGWYEVNYEDGFVETIPIRYGVNILDINVIKRDKDMWEEGRTGAPQNVYCYLADPVECSKNIQDSKMFYSYEWKNPRFGKIITSINLKATKGYVNSDGKVIPDNAVILLALNKVEKRPVPDVR
ncbi:family 20 glycosylhydrolase [candidate division KSB1 bacterium]|nr:family 20 glycosylhydrolase [candidate division KSB1 bacterium]